MVVVLRCVSSVLVGLVFLWPPFAFAAESAFGPKEDERNIIAGICSAQLALGPAACSCLADRAINELDEKQVQHLILSVVQPPAADRTDVAKSQAELASIFTFLEAARQDCAAAKTPPVTPAPSAETPAPADGDAPAEGDGAAPK